MQRVLVTGANGFVGKKLCQELVENSFAVRVALRQLNSGENSRIQNYDTISVGNISAKTQWKDCFQNVNCIVHLAARVHVMQDNAVNPLVAFRALNTAGTERLAREAAKAGVRRFVYVSSIKVNGEETEHPYSEDDLPNPRDPYAISKWEAEQGLHEIAAESGMEVVIVRPPLVYGPGVKANFLRLLQWVDKGIPLPFSMINNRRSFLSLNNLVDFLILCLEHPAAVNETFMVADGEDLSTPALIRKIAFSMGKPARLLPLPPGVLRIGAKLVGKSAEISRLCDSLQIDISKASNILGWKPPLRVDEGIQETADWYIDKYKKRGLGSEI